MIPKMHLKKFPPAPVDDPKKSKISIGEQVRNEILTIDPYLDADLLKIDLRADDAYRYDKYTEKNAMDDAYDINNLK